MDPIKSTRLPVELLTFFSNPGGHSLIIRGDAGTGKTTLALQLIEELAQYNSSYYFSTRVSDILLLVQFPWLGEKLYGKDVDDWLKEQLPGNGREIDPALAQVSAGENKDHDAGLKKLVDIYKNGVSILHNDDSSSLDDVRKAYEAVKGSLPSRSLVVIDSLDALSEKYGLTNATFVTAIQKDLVEGLGANVVFVLENNEKALDYFSDGVATLSFSEHNSRVIRQIKLQKLRGCEIRQSRYLFTLRGGRLQSFSCIGNQDMTATKEWVPIADSGGKISSGIADLDRLIDGGFAPGSVVLFELGESVPAEVINVLERSLVSNFAAQRRGVVWMPMKQVSALSVRPLLTKSIHPSLFDKYVRIPEMDYQAERTGTGHVLYAEGSDVGGDLKWDSITYSLKAADMPYLVLLGFDTLESIYGENVIAGLTNLITSLKRNGGVFVALTSPSTRSSKKLTDLATIHLKLERIDGVLVLYGEAPFTECNAVSACLQEKGGPLSLHPVV
jgi:KaiC/GvpD/RAD55 family RecA-like ATPase